MLLAGADAAATMAACFAAWTARIVVFKEHWPRSWESYFKLPLVFFAVPVVLYGLWIFGLYKPRRDRSVLGELGQISKGVLLAMAFLIVALWASTDFLGSGYSTAHLNAAPTGFGSRLISDGARFQLAVLTLSSLALVATQRVVFRMGLRSLRSRGWNLRHVAVVGVGRLGQITQRTISRNSWTGIHVAYFVSHHDHAIRREFMGQRVEGGLAELESILERHPVDAVYIALPAAESAAMPDLLRRLERFAVDVRIVPDVHPRFLPQSMQVNELEGMPILSYRESPIAGLGGFAKRVLDITGAVVGLLVFSPVMLAVAMLVRLSGPGPVIFKQRRVSLGGEVFNIYKFRTMQHADDERTAGESVRHGWTTRDDPRITPLGRWLRRTSLDELPQLLNVLRGDMSLVGPRPERPELIERFRDDWRGYMLRQHVKAGITGWAQVSGLRGDTSLRKRLQYDLHYIRHWSLWLDVRILFMTIFRGFVHRNAH